MPSDKKQYTVVHLITGLGKGGAETILYQIVKYKSASNLRHVIVSLGLSHYYEDELQKLHVKLIDLNFRKNPILAIMRLRSICDKTQILCCWMYYPCLMGTIVGRKRVERLIWCIRHSDLSKENNSRGTLIASKLCTKLSRKADLITYNGKRALDTHRQAGYRPREEVVLYNGLDLDEYQKSTSVRERLRSELKIENDNTLILSVARDNPIKDLPTFIKAFAKIKQEYPNSIAVMCGTGIDENNEKLTSLINKQGLVMGFDIKLIGFRDDIASLMNAADLFILHSAGEAFPNALIQAMACECLCVSTDVGDVREILGGDAYIARPGDVDGLSGLAINLMSLNEDEKMRIRKKNRQIIESKYDIRQVVKTYEEIFVS